MLFNRNLDSVSIIGKPIGNLTILGSGEFGNVYRGTLDLKYVVVKMLKVR